MLKHCVLVLTLASLFCAVSSMAIAQDNGASNQQSTPGASEGSPGHGAGHGQFDPSKRAAMLAKHLNLSSDQQSKVEDILKSEQSQMQGLRSDSSLSQDDRHSKMMDIHKSSNDQIRTLLNEDQQKKWDEMQSKHQGMMQGHHHGGPGASGSPDSPPPQQQ
jgi:periplasmic protein CpxP/Spy